MSFTLLRSPANEVIKRCSLSCCGNSNCRSQSVFSKFNQRLDTFKMTLPTGLQSLTFQELFNKIMTNMTCQSLPFELYKQNIRLSIIQIRYTLYIYIYIKSNIGNHKRDTTREVLSMGFSKGI